MDREIASDVNGVARKMRKAARLSAQAAEKSLKEDLAPHQRSKQLYRSIQSVVIKETTNVYSASTSVGLDVEHSIYFFEDTRDGVSKLFDGVAGDLCVACCRRDQRGQATEDCGDCTCLTKPSFQIFHVVEPS